MAGNHPAEKRQFFAPILSFAFPLQATRLPPLPCWTRLPAIRPVAIASVGSGFSRNRCRMGGPFRGSDAAKRPFPEGQCRINRPLARGDAAWAHFSRDPMPDVCRINCDLGRLEELAFLDPQDPTWYIGAVLSEMLFSGGWWFEPGILPQLFLWLPSRSGERSDRRYAGSVPLVLLVLLVSRCRPEGF